MDSTQYVDSVSFLSVGKSKGLVKECPSRRESTMSMSRHACQRVKRESCASVENLVGLVRALTGRIWARRFTSSSCSNVVRIGVFPLC